jgi:uncharacterized protein (UPF0276 family)
MHGVGLSLGSAEGLDAAHLDRIADLARRIEPALISEHLSWSIAGGLYLGDLLPLPMTEEALDIVSANILRTQDRLGRAILVENPSSYMLYRHSTIPESEFLAALAKRTGCLILCDVNNIYVSAANHGWSAEDYLTALPPDSIGEIHLAGHSVRTLANGRDIRIDDHGSAIDPAVWALYGRALDLFGPVPTLIERDNNIPPLDSLIAEADRAAEILARTQLEMDHADAA